MGAEVFLHAFENAEPQKVATSQVLACFAGYITQSGDTFIEVVFGPADSSTVYLERTAPAISNLMVHRPCGDARLSECLFRVMQLGNFILFVPGDDFPLVISSDTLVHIPTEMLESLGTPKLAPKCATFVQAFTNPLGSP